MDGSILGFFCEARQDTDITNRRWSLLISALSSRRLAVIIVILLAARTRTGLGHETAVHEQPVREKPTWPSPSIGETTWT
jgi:hypothetical protein